MSRKKAVRKEIFVQAKASWTILLTYLYIVGGIIETQLDFVDKYIPENLRIFAWTGAIGLITFVRMRSITKSAKEVVATKEAEQ